MKAKIIKTQHYCRIVLFPWLSLSIGRLCCVSDVKDDVRIRHLEVFVLLGHDVVADGSFHVQRRQGAAVRART
jgi:hypothetical protein